MSHTENNEEMRCTSRCHKSQRDVQVTINPPNAETEIFIISWTRWLPHIPLGFK